MGDTKTKEITLNLTDNQVISLHAALVHAASIAKKNQIHYMLMHESEKSSPNERSGLWQAFTRWEQHEIDLSKTLKCLQSELPCVVTDFLAFNLFEGREAI